MQLPTVHVCGKVNTRLVLTYSAVCHLVSKSRMGEKHFKVVLKM
jgi:5-methylcytosine-specific restriction endonuclease McrA